MTVKTALAEGLFASTVQPSQHLSRSAARGAAFAALKEFGEAGCACCVADEFGEHPDTAAARMAWALDLVGAR